MKVVSICQEMGWTYWEYMRQPSWFLELLNGKLQIDSEQAKRIINQQKSQARK